MKKKALITIGCSFTEGVGCYDYTQLPIGKSVTDLTDDEFAEYYGSQLDNFLEGSWGTHLAKLLNYDLHINCGIGGSANSHQLKNFMDTMVDWPDLSEYEVLVMWQMTYSHRFSFYGNGKPLSYGFNNTNKFDKLQDEDILGNPNNLVKSFIHSMGDGLFQNTSLESLFHLRCLIEICKSNGYNFLFSTVNDDILDDTISEYLNEDYLNKYIKIYDLKNKKHHSPLHSAFEGYETAHCGHPTSDGYKNQANEYFNWIRNVSAELISKNKNVRFKAIPMNRDYNIITNGKRLK